MQATVLETKIEARPHTAPLTLAGAICSVAGIGYYLPENILTNEHFVATVDTSNEWIVERTGIHGRHAAAPEEATSDLSYLAASAALADAKMSASDLDLILLATSTGDSPVPATACYLQARFGCKGVPSMDVAAGCSGFGYALQLAAGAVKSGLHRRVLVVGADCLTRITNYADRQSCILFGDGAGAAVVARHDAPGSQMDVLYSDIGADGSAADLIRIVAGGSRHPASAKSVAASQHTMELKGREIYKVAVRQMTECVRKAADTLGISPADFDLVIPHQANARIIESVGHQLDVKPDRLVIDIAETGNTAAASIPIALCRARSRGLTRSGQLIIVIGFGAGTTWACQVFRMR